MNEAGERHGYGANSTSECNDEGIRKELCNDSGKRGVKKEVSEHAWSDGEKMSSLTAALIGVTERTACGMKVAGLTLFDFGTF